MTYIPYHSGSAPETADRPDLLDAVRALTPFGLMPAGARPFTAAVPGVTAEAPQGTPVFRVFFWTSTYGPNHIVTLRNAVDGWERDVHGVYKDGRWEFELERRVYPDGLDCKLVLDRTTWMDGFNLQLPQDRDHHLDEGAVRFPYAESRFRHGYDNLRTEDAPLQQGSIRRNINPAAEYDVIIVGSGFGGGTLADALSDAGVNTLVLEAGSLIFPSHITNLPGDWSVLPARHQVGHFTNLQGSSFLFGVQMNLGGRSVFWSGLIPRMHAWEVENWPDPVAGYLSDPNPQTGYGLAEALMRKQRIFGRFQEAAIAKLAARFPDHAVENLPRSRHQPDPGPQEPLANVLEKSTGTFSTADLLLDSMAYSGLAGRDNLTINVNHLVTGLQTDGARRVTHVVCQDLVGNQERRYRARVAVVLAAGSLESPRIAQRSGLTDPNGKIGRGLTDHPAFFSREYALAPGGEFSGVEDHAKIFMHHRQASGSAHPFNVEVLINPKYWEVRHPDDDIRKARLSAQVASGTRCQFVFASQLDDENFIRDHGPGRKAEVRVKPNGAGEAHRNEVMALRNDMLGFLGAQGLNPNEGMHYGNEGTVHHAGGTLRMSGDGTGVVDAGLRFEAYDNLYACDASVFPYIPAANPALTIVALAQRLATDLS